MHASPRHSLTKNTNYASIGLDRSPLEVLNGASANNRLAKNNLDKSKQSLKSMHRKSLGQLDFQRKMLEKSMLAYSDKMKSISNKRTNNLFREINSRNSETDRGTKSLDSVDIISFPTDSANLRKRKGHHGSLHSIYSHVREEQFRHSPIAESIEVAKTERLSSPKPFKARIYIRRSSSADLIKAKQFKSLDENKSVRFPSIKINVHSDDKDTVSTGSAKSFITESVKSDTVRDSPVRYDTSSDSAYSSCTDSEDVSSIDTPRSTAPNNVNKSDNALLTVPKVHKRKRTRSQRKSTKEDHSLHKSVLLKNTSNN